MLSTPEERSASPSSSRRSPYAPSPSTSSPFASPNSMQPPSIAQIAMGLHTSRTPHLGPSHSHSRGRLSSDPGAPRGAPSRSPVSRTASSSSSHLALPLRSSLKTRPSTSASDYTRKSSPRASRSTSPSVSVSTASVPATPQSAFSRLSLSISNASRARFERFLGLGTRSSSGSASSLTYGSEGEFELPRKSVRFMSILEDENDRKDANAVVVRTVSNSGNE